MSARENKVFGILAEYETQAALLAACRHVRDAGFKKWDAHTPFPVHGLDGAMGLRSTRLPWIVLAGGLSGFSGALLLQWWTNAYDYPFLISGKPLWSIPANIPVAFELTILLAAFGAFFGMLVSNRLPELYHPVFKSDRFRRASTDRFFICIEASDPRFDLAGTEKLLREAGSRSVEILED